MARIAVPTRLLDLLGPEMKMDVRWVDVKLRDGRVLRNLVVRGRGYFTGRESDPNGEGPLDFTTDDVVAIRPHALIWGRWRSG
jgi:hypothetical protein